MSTEVVTDDVGERWARLRFAVVGALLASPPRRGELSRALERLAARQWQHPTTGETVRFGYSTIERWYYQARGAPNPVTELARRVRRDAGQSRAMSDGLLGELEKQWRQHSSWSYQLHADNLAALAVEQPGLGTAPSYTTVRRRMQERGWNRRRRLGAKATEAQRRAAERLEQREVRSYEARYVHGLWHLDFHGAKRRRVVDAYGEWHTPQCLCILDDRSRLCCHIQWYLEETARALVQGLGQAFAKRGLPRDLMSDNGSAMRAAETAEGLCGLGVRHSRTLEHSPYQNGKQEAFWDRLEGRAMAMLEDVEPLSLSFLNQATQAWAELEYNREVHEETGQPPIERMLAGPTVGRPGPHFAELRWLFTRKAQRTQRRSDGTVSIAGVRFELPSRLRTLRRVWVRWSAWDLSEALVVDARDHRKPLASIYPQDKERNADGRRRAVQPVEPAPNAPAEREPIPPLMRKLLADYAATGMPPAYIPMNDADTGDDEENDDA